MRLQREALIQRERYPSIAGMSRMEAYPELRHSGRPYDPAEERQMWDLARVYQFLAVGVYHRRANPRGFIYVYGWSRGLGRAHCGKRSSCVLTPDHESGLLATIKARS